jgi:DNA-binding HxlR family transcriptional regulator
MMRMNEKGILRVLAHSHALEILEGLDNSPLRFTDMEHICPSRKTRYIRLRELEQEKLVRVSPKLIGHRSYTYYEMTEKGMQALKLVRGLLLLDKVKPGSCPS